MTDLPKSSFVPLLATPLPDRLRARLNLGTIPGLDGIRSVAVLLVMVIHFGVESVTMPLES